jgi:phage terminase Nu1 subunit (DNA packaging protein)
MHHHMAKRFLRSIQTFDERVIVLVKTSPTVQLDRTSTRQIIRMSASGAAPIALKSCSTIPDYSHRIERG